jgi:SCY1-like protein 2
MTAQSLYLLISNMEVLEKFVTDESFMSSIIPLYLKCFDCPPKLKLLALRHIERLTKKYDYQFTKTKIVPKLVISMKDEKIEVRKDTLKALYGIITRLDPHTIVNVVLGGL